MNYYFLYSPVKAHAKIKILEAEELLKELKSKNLKGLSAQAFQDMRRNIAQKILELNQ